MQSQYRRRKNPVLSDRQKGAYLLQRNIYNKALWAIENWALDERNRDAYLQQKHAFKKFFLDE
jgi:hypothetical protein